MKKKQTVLLGLFLSAVTFSACEKNLYDESKQPEKNQTVADLKIPANFDWNMIKSAECIVNSSTNTSVSIYLDENCSEDKAIASFTTDSEGTPFPLNVPTYVKQLYLQYETVGGQKATTSAAVDENGNFHFILPAITRAMASNGNNGNIDPDKNGVVAYPMENGWGTIMFEDLFPSLGDYDFNDFVANYRVQLYDVKRTSKGNDKGYTTSSMMIGVRLKAIGGSLPYRPYLRIHGLNRNNIGDIYIHQSFNTNMTEIKFIEGGNGETIIDLSELCNILSRPTGGKLYNVEKDYAISSDLLPQINIYVEFNDPIKIKGNLEDKNFEIYLANENTSAEIHMNGFEPVTYIYPVGNSNLLPLNNDVSNYYYSTNRLIWGMKIPANVIHATEKADFLKAYPNFEKWATSGGQNASNWYDQGNKDSNLLMPE